MNELHKYIESRENACMTREEVENLLNQVLACYFDNEISPDEFLDMVYSIMRIETYKLEQINPRMRNLLEQILIKHTNYAWVGEKLNALLNIATNLDLPGLLNKIENTADYWLDRDMYKYNSIRRGIDLAEEDAWKLRRERWEVYVRFREFG